MQRSRGGPHGGGLAALAGRVNREEHLLRNEAAQRGKAGLRRQPVVPNGVSAAGDVEGAAGAGGNRPTRTSQGADQARAAFTAA